MVAGAGARLREWPQEDSFGDDANVLYSDWGGGFLQVGTYQSVSNCVLQVDAVCFSYIMPQ